MTNKAMCFLTGMKYPASNPPRNQLITPTIGLPLWLPLVHLAWQPLEFRVGKITDGILPQQPAEYLPTPQQPAEYLQAP